MKVNFVVYFLIVWVGCMFYSCLSQPQKDEKLARQYCGSCHIFPEASMLSKSTWDKTVLPQMAFRMSLDYSILHTLPEADQREVMLTLPAQAMVTEAEWAAIKRYYQISAPDSLHASTLPIADTLTEFGAEPVAFNNFPLNTFITADTIHQKLYTGSRLSKLYRLNSVLIPEDSFQLSSPPSQVLISGDDEITLLLMGIMDPNDQPSGSLVSMRVSDRQITSLIDSLKRPVHFQRTDLDGDKLEDVVICSFGNYSGALEAFKNKGNGAYERIVLMSAPGARKIIITDFDKNGLNDIVALMSQGDEKIVAFLNQGNFDFRVNTLLRFPPVYGSSYFELADLNNDGKIDILYTNGDNADYSIVLKPYHGVRIFLNNGSNDFAESWFYNMHGASQATARDFDNDGDLDIAAISFFPEFRKHPEQGFIYFENTGSGYIPKITPLGKAGRWLTMETYDIDRDGDTDILLSALDFNSGIPGELLAEWKSKRTSILLLRNNLVVR